MEKMTVNRLKDILFDGGVYADTIGKNKEGEFVVRKGFFYTCGGTAEKLSNSVAAALTKAGVAHRITNAGEKWKAFRGGASVASQSHWYVHIRLEGEGQ